MRIVAIAFILSILLGTHFSTTAAMLARQLPDGPMLSDVKATLAQAAAANW